MQTQLCIRCKSEQDQSSNADIRPAQPTLSTLPPLLRFTPSPPPLPPTHLAIGKHGAGTEGANKVRMFFYLRTSTLGSLRACNVWWQQTPRETRQDKTIPLPPHFHRSTNQLLQKYDCFAYFPIKTTFSNKKALLQKQNLCFCGGRGEIVKEWESSKEIVKE